MFEEVRKAGLARSFIFRADVIGDGDGDSRHARIALKGDFETVVEFVRLDVKLGGFGRFIPFGGQDRESRGDRHSKHACMLQFHHVLISFTESSLQAFRPAYLVRPRNGRGRRESV